MTPITEIDAMKVVEATLSKIEEPAARDRILNWAWAKFASQTVATKRSAARGSGPATTKPKAKSKSTKNVPTMVKDLNLMPSDKKSFAEFANEKNPSGMEEKCAVSVYYIQRELEIGAATTNHVYTCFKHMKWRIPADLNNKLACAASMYGWLDTSDMSDIKLTTHGENLIEHDLPKKKSSN